MSPKVVLLVEDDDAVSNVYRRALEKAGYQVLTAPDGERALGIVESDERVDLILSDMVMPGIGGRELVWRARDVRPELRIILISGYATEGGALQTLEEMGVDFVQKPVDLRTMLSRVRAKLEDPVN